MTRLKAFAISVAVTVCQLPLHASDLTIFAGVQNPGNITLTSTRQGVTDIIRNGRNFGVLGARLRHGPPIIGFEHTLARSSNFIDSRAAATIYNSNLIVQPPAAVVKPYVTAGAGIIRVKGDGPAAVGTKFGVNYGGGIKIGFTDLLGIRFDVRGYNLRSVQKQSLNVFETSLGIVFSY